MDKQREIYIQELKRLKMALKSTKSTYLKKDYQKAIKRKEKQLRIYDNFHKKRSDI
jgi:hypothetical protein